MSFKRALAIATVGLAALPAVAAAQTEIQAPQGDNYLQPIFLNDERSALAYNNPIGFIADTSTYTVQADMFNPNGDGSPGGGGPPEPNQCGNSLYGNTVWSVFFAHRFGLMRISTAGPFDSVIGVVPFSSPSRPTPDLNNGTCIDALSGFEEELSGIVVPGQWYAVQVGGTGNPPGGRVQVKFDLQPPPQVDADAVLSWNTAPGGAKVKSLVISAPRSARVTISCARRSCGRTSFTARKIAAGGPLTKPFGTVGPKAKAAPGVAMRRSAASAGDVADFEVTPARAKAQVHAAKKYKKLAGRKLPAGARLEVRVSFPGYIGKYFAWTVKSSGVSTKVVRCMNPGSTKPRKRCSG